MTPETETPAPVKCPFPYFGGKNTPRIKNLILSLLPPHDFYIEPFGGGASILLSKPPCGNEVYNDVNRGVVNFFRVVSDPVLFEKFHERVTLMPDSRELFDEFRMTWYLIRDPVEQAVRWYILASQSFSGHFANSWAIQISDVHGRWINRLKLLPPVHRRMQRVRIECADWRNVLDVYRGPGWLAYCDPPYVKSTRKTGGYAHELTDRDHEELIERLMNYDGAVVLSGYDNPIYGKLTGNGWDRHEIQVYCSSYGRTRKSGVQGQGSSTHRGLGRTEVVWRNPEALRRIAEAEAAKTSPDSDGKEVQPCLISAV